MLPFSTYYISMYISIKAIILKWALSSMCSGPFMNWITQRIKHSIRRLFKKKLNMSSIAWCGLGFLKSIFCRIEKKHRRVIFSICYSFYKRSSQLSSRRCAISFSHVCFFIPFLGKHCPCYFMRLFLPSATYFMERRTAVIWVLGFIASNILREKNKAPFTGGFIWRGRLNGISENDAPESKGHGMVCLR